MEIILPLVVILGIYHTIRIYLAGREAKKKYPPADYLTTSTPNSDPWRWRKPHDRIGLQVVDDEEHSSITFPTRFKMDDYLITLAGTAAIIAGIVILLFGLGLYFSGGPEEEVRGKMSFFLAGAGFFFGAVCFSVRQKIVKIIRTPAQMIIQYTYGVLFKRTVTYPQNMRLAIKVKDQRITDYDTAQETPFYEITVKKANWLSFSPSTFYICANPSQISWLQGGLSDYFTPATHEPDGQDQP